MTVVAAFALSCGLFRSASVVSRWLFTNRIGYVSRDFVWMAPLGTLMVFALPALLLAVLAYAWPRLASLRTVVFLACVPAVLSVLLPFGQIHDAASLLLSLGAAWRVAELASRQPERTARTARRVVAGAAVLTALAAGAVRPGRQVAEALAVARKPAAPAGAPNVLIVVLDAVRASQLSLYGYHRPTTPGLERWAHDGTTFDWAMSPSSWTMPSHEAFFTGRFPGQLSGNFRTGLDATYPTLAEVLGRHGYRTAGFASNPFYTTRESGLARGFDYYDATHPTLREILLNATLMQSRVARNLADAEHLRDALHAVTPPRFYLNPNLVHDPAPADVPVRRFLHWQAGIHDRPFFAFLNLFDAHRPYLAPEPWPTRFAAQPGDTDRYDGAIAYEDAMVDTLLQTLQRRGVLDRTIVIVTSDHGEQFGEHGLTYHGNSLYMPLLHVPLLMRYPPRVPAGRRIDRASGLRRLAATALDLAGIMTDEIPGPSLSAAWRNPAADTESVRLQMPGSEDENPAAPKGPLRAVVSDRWHYIVQHDGKELLFDYRSDSLELVNLAGTPVGDSALPALRQRAATLPGQP